MAAAWVGDATDVQPYKDRATAVATVSKTERLLAASAKAPNATIAKRIQSHADALFRALWPHVEAEADALGVEARQGLALRARRESTSSARCSNGSGRPSTRRRRDCARSISSK